MRIFKFIVMFFTIKTSLTIMYTVMATLYTNTKENVWK